MRKAGRKPVGGNYAVVKQKVKQFGIDVSHFTGMLWNKGKTRAEDPRIPSVVKHTYDEVFKKDSEVSGKCLRDNIKRYEVLIYKCDICGCDGNWQGGKISLEVHHKDGDNHNNEVENLQYLCPNCHALTDN